MRRFTFNLQTVLALREHAEQDARRSLAAELALQAQRDSDLAAARSATLSARGRSGPRAGEQLSSTQLAARQAFLERREREQAAANARALAQVERVAHERAELEVAARERDALERLKERRREAHRRVVAHLEELALGDAALAAHRRGLGGGRAA